MKGMLRSIIGDGQRETLGIGAEAPERLGQGDHAVQQPLHGRGGGQNRRRHDAHQDVQDDAGRRGAAQLPPLEQADHQQDGQHRPDGTIQAARTGPAEQEQAAHHGAAPPAETSQSTIRKDAMPQPTTSRNFSHSGIRWISELPGT